MFRRESKSARLRKIATENAELGRTTQVIDEAKVANRELLAEVTTPKTPQREIEERASRAESPERSKLEYRLGEVLVRHRRRPLSWPLLPFKLYRIYRDFVEERSRAAIDKHGPESSQERGKRKGAAAKAAEAGDNVAKASPDPAPLLGRLLDELKRPGPAPQLQLIEQRVCYVLNNSLPYASGGYALRSHGLAQGLVSHGFEVIAVTRPGFPAEFKEFSEVANHTIDGVRYFRINSPWRTTQSNAEYTAAIVPTLEAAFRDLRPSIVIAASFYFTALPAMIAARRLGIPFIYELRNFIEITKMSRDATYYGTEDYKLHVALEAETGKHAAHMFTLTRGMREECISRGIDASKITLLPNSCDPERFTPANRDKPLADQYGFPPDIPVIGYVGTIVDYEGLDDLISACLLLKERGTEFRVLVVGSDRVTGGVGKLSHAIKSAAQAGGLGDWLVMPGRVPHEQVRAFCSLIDIAVYPRKPWPVCEMVSPLKPLEALAMGKAVVVSSVAALAEMIEDNKTAVVFEKANIAALADALEGLIHNKELRRNLGQEARKYVACERTWSKTASVAVEVIRSLLRREAVRKPSQAPIETW